MLENDVHVLIELMIPRLITLDDDGNNICMAITLIHMNTAIKRVTKEYHLQLQ
jgi:hypothetical protein